MGLPNCTLKTLMTYAIIIEQTHNGYSAYVPDLPGCVAAAGSFEDTEKLIRDAVVVHLESLQEHGDSIPEPQTSVGLVEVPVVAQDRPSS